MFKVETFKYRLRTTKPLSTFPFIPLLSITGKALRKKKLLDTDKKVNPFVALIRNPDKNRERNRFTTESSFLPESAGSELLSCLVITQTNCNFSLLIDSPSEPFYRVPFFEKAKFRNLEISRPYS